LGIIVGVLLGVKKCRKRIFPHRDRSRWVDAHSSISSKRAPAEHEFVSDREAASTSVNHSIASRHSATHSLASRPSISVPASPPPPSALVPEQRSASASHAPLPIPQPSSLPPPTYLTSSLPPSPPSNPPPIRTPSGSVSTPPLLPGRSPSSLISASLNPSRPSYVVQVQQQTPQRGWVPQGQGRLSGVKQ
jgi:hypothetical protein